MKKAALRILHTNDLHSDFDHWLKVTALIKDKKEGHQNVLIFDIGDHTDRVNPITEASDGKANITLMNQVGYNGATIGNNEGITFSKESLERLYEKANFPVIVANVLDTKGERPKWIKPYQIIVLPSGVKVGVIGLTVPFYSFYRTLGWQIIDPFLIVENLLEEVKRQVDIVILLSHLGLTFDEQMAERFEDIDVILGGHTHDVLLSGKSVNKTLIAQAGKSGQYVGQVDIEFDLDKKKPVEISATCLPVAEYREDRQTKKLLSEIAEQEVVKLSQRIAVLEKPLPISWTQDSPFAQLLATALKQWCQAEIGMVNSGVLLDSLNAGPVTSGDLHRICPHPINPGRVMVKGDIVEETVKHALTDEMIHKKITGLGFRGKVMGMMVFDGLEYESSRLEDGMVHIHSIKINGVPLCREKDYSVATIDIFLFSKIYPQIAKSKEKQYYMPEFLRDVLRWKLQQA